MKPFIYKFALIHKNLNYLPLSDMIYDSDIEQMVYVRSGEKSLVINDTDVYDLTGSLFTKARTDPTLDEPTDR